MKFLERWLSNLGSATGWQTYKFHRPLVLVVCKFNLMLRNAIKWWYILFMYLMYGVRNVVACKIVVHSQLTLTLFHLLLWAIPLGVSIAATSVVLDSVLNIGSETRNTEQKNDSPIEILSGNRDRVTSASAAKEWAMFLDAIWVGRIPT